MSATPAPAVKKVNLRTPEVMEAVQAQVEKHYRSHAVEFVRATGQPLVAKDMTVVLAKAFGFCHLCLIGLFQNGKDLYRDLLSFLHRCFEN